MQTDGEKEVAAHEDMEDEGQTVKVAEETPESPVLRIGGPKTGDASHIQLLILMISSLAGVIGYYILRKKRKAEEEN